MEELVTVQNLVEIATEQKYISMIGMVQIFKQSAKRAIGKGIRRLRSYVRSLEAEANKADHDTVDDPDRYEFAYLWLNSIFRKLLSEEGKALRPNYTWGVLQGVHLAKVLGIDRVSVIEFGVAGGNGLVSLERSAKRIEDILGVGVDVYGFDTGRGLPKPLDYRDCPNLWSEGLYLMDEEKLRKRLQSARLFLGLVDETISRFIKSKPAPVAFISFDLDYYTSTVQAFKLLEENPALLLPRIYCYFDDIMGFTYSEYNGERLAISEFNSSHDMRKISMLHGLRYQLPSPYSQAQWSEQFYIAHIFDHKLYCAKDNLGGAPWGRDLKPAASIARNKLQDNLKVEVPHLGESLKTKNRKAEALPNIHRLPDSPPLPSGEHDQLLDFIDDVVIARTLEGRIHLWNRHAEELFGWRKHEAIGRVSHDLLQTQFPQPLKEIDSELYGKGYWQGKLVHTTRSGDRVVVESRWSLAPKEDSPHVVEIVRRAAD